MSDLDLDELEAELLDDLHGNSAGLLPLLPD
jgi:hypothetical protein